ncbi:unnamed protein product [Heligmosomoides polygyrus]|uniref:Uncharacterized protein n=1 Tax=Heligmosomoides polygyrus TaxID=6339 RepID=A0A183FQ52_HELPZ|nr:unnamed protein product [Heligmosomoides polygyrus]
MSSGPECKITSGGSEYSRPEQRRPLDGSNFGESGEEHPEATASRSSPTERQVTYFRVNRGVAADRARETPRPPCETPPPPRLAIVTESSNEKRHIR